MQIIKRKLERIENKKKLKKKLRLLSTPQSDTRDTAAKDILEIISGWGFPYDFWRKEPQFVDKFLLHLDDEDRMVRDRMIRILGKVHDVRAIPRLIIRLGNPDDFRVIVEVLARFYPNPEAINPLISILEDPGESEEKKSEIAQALGKEGDRRAIPQLIRMLQYSVKISSFNIQELSSILSRIDDEKAEEASLNIFSGSSETISQFKEARIQAFDWWKSVGGKKEECAFCNRQIERKDGFIVASNWGITLGDEVIGNEPAPALICENCWGRHRPKTISQVQYLKWKEIIPAIYRKKTP